jgi:hypothetical protein
MNKILSISIIGILLFGGIGVFGVNPMKTSSDNHPPGRPIIDGPRTIGPGPHDWTFKAIDPDGDNVSYAIDWGDGVVELWIGPYASGEEVTRSHEFLTKGTPLIKAKANDSHGAIGEWGFMYVVISESDLNGLLPIYHWKLFLFGRLYNLSVNGSNYHFDSHNLRGMETSRHGFRFWEIRFFHYTGNVGWSIGGDIHFRGILRPDFICGVFYTGIFYT